jgi:hypothetical protein
MYVKYIPTDKLVLGIPSNNMPLTLDDEKNSGLKAKINRKNPNSELFRNIIAVSKYISYKVIKSFGGIIMLGKMETAIHTLT